MGGALGGDGADGQNCVSPVSVSLTFLTVLLVLVGDALLFPLPLGSAVESLDLGVVVLLSLKALLRMMVQCQTWMGC